MKKLLKISELLEKADEMLNSGNYTRMIEIYDEVLRIDPKNCEALINISDCFLKLKMDEYAGRYALKAYDLYFKEEDMTAVNYSCVLIHQKKYRKAIEILEREKRKKSDNYLIYNNLGYVYFLELKYYHALENYNYSILLEEKNPLAYCNRGVLKYYIFDDIDGIEDLSKAKHYGDIEALIVLQKIKQSLPDLN